MRLKLLLKYGPEQIARLKFYSHNLRTLLSSNWLQLSTDQLAGAKVFGEVRVNLRVIFDIGKTEMVEARAKPHKLLQQVIQHVLQKLQANGCSHWFYQSRLFYTGGPPVGGGGWPWDRHRGAYGMRLFWNLNSEIWFRSQFRFFKYFFYNFLTF